MQLSAFNISVSNLHEMVHIGKLLYIHKKQSDWALPRWTTQKPGDKLCHNDWEQVSQRPIRAVSQIVVLELLMLSF